MRESENSLQVVIIDFGQAVDCNHPSALKLLQRDVFMIQAFFKKQGIVTLKDDEAEQFIVRKVRELVDHCNNAYSVKSDAFTNRPNLVPKLLTANIVMRCLK